MANKIPKKLKDWVESNIATFDQLNHVIFVKDTEFNYVYYNSSFLTLYPKFGEIEGKLTDFDILPEEIATQQREREEKLIKTKQNQIYQSKHEISGNDRYFKSTISPISVDNEIIGMLGIATNITEEITETINHREDIKELQKIVNQFQKIVEYSPFGIIISQGLQTIFANKSMRELLKCTHHDIDECIKPSMWTKESLEKLTEYREKRESGEDVTDEYEVTLIDEEGRRIPVIHRVRRVNLPNFDEPVNLSFFQDISDRKEKERLREMINERTNQKRRIEALGNLASGIAHKINNHMTPILGFTSIMKANKSDKELFYIDSIEKAAREIKKLTSSILNFSDQEDTHEMQLTDIEEFIQNSKSFFSTVNPFLVYKLEDTFKVKINQGELRQAIINIIENAVEAIIEEEIIVLRTGTTSIDDNYISSNYIYGETQTGEFSTISIINKGNKIKENKISRIFEPYYTTKQFGKGMGLAVTLGIINRHMGMIEVDSRTERTKFVLYLPKIEE